MGWQRWLEKVTAGVAAHLNPGESIRRVVVAATRSRLWQLLPTTAFFLGLLVIDTAGRSLVHSHKIATMTVLICLLLTGEVARAFVKSRIIVVTDQRVLVFNGGYYSSMPGKQPARELPLAIQVDIPSSRSTSFDAVGERLYVRRSFATAHEGGASTSHQVPAVARDATTRVDRQAS
jgi:hypothetical protein